MRRNHLGERDEHLRYENVIMNLKEIGYKTVKRTRQAYSSVHWLRIWR